ncbi:MAG: hypothetical protein NC177_10845 [Ruminococcus flavefaciens]|nr:hypothetical protein [Ruminococcus flavefaciens]
MVECQVYLYDEQKNYLIKYMRDKRDVHIIPMGIAFAFIAVCTLVFLVLTYNTGIKDAVDILDEVLLYYFVALVSFLSEFVSGYGKFFGRRCDIQCIEKDLYTLDYGDFGYREKDTGKHPYYICDNRGGIYICPRYIDYRNADTGSKFLYIKLENGRNYAIAEK